MLPAGNLKFARLRAKWVGPHKKRRIAEPVILCLIYISLLFFITYSYPCSSDMSVAMSACAVPRRNSPHAC